VGRVPTAADLLKNPLGQGLILHERRIALRDGHVGFREHHLEVVERRFEEWPCAQHLTQ
jgi:hypothetical protein